MGQKVFYLQNLGFFSWQFIAGLTNFYVSIVHTPALWFTNSTDLIYPLSWHASLGSSLILCNRSIVLLFSIAYYYCILVPFGESKN